MATLLKSKHLYFLPEYSLFAPVSHLSPVGATLRRVCWCAVREHVVPSIIDGQGQRARRRRSTQPECDKAAQSDRATHNTSSLSFSFDTHVTLLRAWVLSGNWGESEEARTGEQLLSKGIYLFLAKIMDYHLTEYSSRPLFHTHTTQCYHWWGHFQHLPAVMG